MALTPLRRPHPFVAVTILQENRSKGKYDPSRPPWAAACAACTCIAGRGDRAGPPGFLGRVCWRDGVVPGGPAAHTLCCNSDARDHTASRCGRSPGSVASRTFAAAEQPDPELSPLPSPTGWTTAVALCQVSPVLLVNLMKVYRVRNPAAVNGGVPFPSRLFDTIPRLRTRIRNECTPAAGGFLDVKWRGDYGKNRRSQMRGGCGNDGLWKTRKTKSGFSIVSHSPWKSQKARFPHSHSPGDVPPPPKRKKRMTCQRIDRHSRCCSRCGSRSFRFQMIANFQVPIPNSRLKVSTARSALTAFQNS